MINIYKKVSKFKTKFPSTIAWRLKKHCKVIEDYLNPDETILYVFCGQKNDCWYDITSSCVVVLTNKRLLIGRKLFFGRSSFIQVTPDMYNDLKIYRGIFFGKITIDTIKEEIILTNLSNSCLDEIETNISEFMMKEKKK